MELHSKCYHPPAQGEGRVGKQGGTERLLCQVLWWVLCQPHQDPSCSAPSPDQVLVPALTQLSPPWGITAHPQEGPIKKVTRKKWCCETRETPERVSHLRCWPTTQICKTANNSICGLRFKSIYRYQLLLLASHKTNQAAWVAAWKGSLDFSIFPIFPFSPQSNLSRSFLCFSLQLPS